jgi:hypothetical protein
LRIDDALRWGIEAEHLWMLGGNADGTVARSDSVGQDSERFAVGDSLDPEAELDGLNERVCVSTPDRVPFQCR